MEFLLLGAIVLFLVFLVRANDKDELRVNDNQIIDDDLKSAGPTYKYDPDRYIHIEDEEDIHQQMARLYGSENESVETSSQEDEDYVVGNNDHICGRDDNGCEIGSGMVR